MKKLEMKVFHPGVIGPMVIKNRLVRSATFEQGATDEGEVTDFLVGLYRDLSKMEEILQEGSVDFCAMSRPFVREPDLPNRWRSQIPARKAACTSCNACLPLPGRSLECRFEKKEYAGGKHLLDMFPFFQLKRI